MMAILLKRRAMRVAAAGLAALAAATVATTVAAKTSPAQASASPPTITYAAADHSSGWLPFVFWNGVRIILPATVNGHPVRAFVDSGASEMILDRRFADTLHLRADGTDAGTGIGGTGSSDVVHGVSVQLGRLTINARKGIVIDEKPAEALLGFPMPFVIGGQAFSDLVVDIDFAHRRIAFIDPAVFRAPPGATALPAQRAGELRTVDLTIDGRPARMLFDIGNGTAALLYPRFWQQAGFLDGRRLSTTLNGGWAGAKPQKVTMLGTVGFGPAVFHDVPATLLDNRSGGGETDGVSGNVGMPLSSRFHLILDFPHDRVFVAPPIDTTTPFQVNHTGLTLRTVAAGRQVAYVAPGSSAADAGLKIGDIVSAVTDLTTRRPVALSSNCQLRRSTAECC